MGIGFFGGLALFGVFFIIAFATGVIIQQQYEEKLKNESESTSPTNTWISTDGGDPPGIRLNMDIMI